MAEQSGSDLETSEGPLSSTRCRCLVESADEGTEAPAPKRSRAMSMASEASSCACNRGIPAGLDVFDQPEHRLSTELQDARAEAAQLGRLIQAALDREYNQKDELQRYHVSERESKVELYSELQRERAKVNVLEVEAEETNEAAASARVEAEEASEAAASNQAALQRLSYSLSVENVLRLRRQEVAGFRQRSEADAHRSGGDRNDLATKTNACMADLEYEIQEASARQAIMRTDIGDLQRAAWEAAAAKAREKSAADKIRYEATVSALRQQESELVTQLEAEQQARSKAITEYAQQQRCLQTQVDNANVELAEDALELHKSQCEVAQLRRALQAAHGSGAGEAEQLRAELAEQRSEKAKFETELTGYESELAKWQEGALVDLPEVRPCVGAAAATPSPPAKATQPPTAAEAIPGAVSKAAQPAAAAAPTPGAPAPPLPKLQAYQAPTRPPPTPPILKPEPAVAAPRQGVPAQSPFDVLGWRAASAPTPKAAPKAPLLLTVVTPPSKDHVKQVTCPKCSRPEQWIIKVGPAADTTYHVLDCQSEQCGSFQITEGGQLPSVPQKTWADSNVDLKRLCILRNLADGGVHDGASKNASTRLQKMIAELKVRAKSNHEAEKTLTYFWQNEYRGRYRY